MKNGRRTEDDVLDFSDPWENHNSYQSSVIRFGRIAHRLTNGIAICVQAVLLVLVLLK